MHSLFRPVWLIILITALSLNSCRNESNAGSAEGVIWNSEDWSITRDRIKADKVYIFCNRTDSTITPGYISQTPSVDHFFNDGIRWSLTLSDTWNYPIDFIAKAAPLIAFTDSEQAVALIRSTAERCIVTSNYWPLTESNACWIDAARLVALATGDPDLP